MFSGAAVVMGVSSCGKTSVGEALADRLGARFVEGDTLHPASNIAKMTAGLALSDADRWPWLQRVGETLRGETGVIASCSALKHAYRQCIVTSAGRPVAFVFLNGSRDLLKQRMARRTGHFMPPSLLASQLATLEPPTGEEWARAFLFDLPVGDIAEEAANWLLQTGTHT